MNADHLPPVNVTQDMPLRDTLIIGCGGFGILAAAYVRARLSKFLEVNNLKRIRFLGIDTMTSLETGKYDILKYFNQDDLTSLSAASNIRDILLNPKNFPDITQSLPDLDEISETGIKRLLEIIDPPEGAGTQRLYSRLCLRSLAGNIDNISKKISALFTGDDFSPKNSGPPVITKEPVNWTHIFLISSLYGGTGSGIFLDVAAICRTLGKLNNDRTTFITGLFFLPSFLDSRHSHQFQAQSYASLKEIDHYLSGNPLQWSYPNGLKIDISNGDARDKLFNMVFLMDTPDQAGKLRGSDEARRCQLAESGADLIFHLCATGIGQNFFARHVDMASSRARFITMYPELTRDEKDQRIQKEQRITAYSAAHFKTVGVDQEVGREFLLARYAVDLFESCFGSSGMDYSAADKIIKGFAADPPLSEILGLTYDALLARYRSITIQPVGFSPETPVLIRSLAPQIDLARQNAAEITRKLGIAYTADIQKRLAEMLNTHGIDTARLVLGKLRDFIAGDSCIGKFNEHLTKLNQEINLQSISERLNNLATEAANAIDMARQETQESWMARGLRNAASFIRVSPSSEQNRFHQRLPDYLGGTVGQVQRIIRSAVDIAIHSQLSELLQQILNQIDILEYQEFEPVFERISAIRDRLNDRAKVLNPRALVRDSLSFIHVSQVYAGFESRYYAHFLNEIPRTEHPVEKGRRLKASGLEVRTGEIIQLNGFGRFTISEILQAIDAEVQKTVGSVARNLIIDYNVSEIFPCNEPPLENSFEGIRTRLKDADDPLLPCTQCGCSETMTIGLAASLTDSGIPSWSDTFPTTPFVKGSVSGLVTYGTLKLGFPLIALNHLRTWHFEYLKYLYQRLPVHVVKSAVYAKDIYFDQTFQSDTVNNDIIYFMAVDSDIAAIQENPSKGVILGNPTDAHRIRSDLRNMFYDPFKQTPIFLSESDFKKEMQVNYILTHEVFSRTINRIIEKIHAKDRHPDFRWHDVRLRLIEELTNNGFADRKIIDFIDKIDDIRKSV